MSQAMLFLRVLVKPAVCGSSVCLLLTVAKAMSPCAGSLSTFLGAGYATDSFVLDGGPLGVAVVMCLQTLDWKSFNAAAGSTSCTFSAVFSFVVQDVEAFTVGLPFLSELLAGESRREAAVLGYCNSWIGKASSPPPGLQAAHLCCFRLPYRTLSYRTWRLTPQGCLSLEVSAWRLNVYKLWLVYALPHATGSLVVGYYLSQLGQTWRLGLRLLCEQWALAG